MKQIFCFTLIAFLVTACSKSNESSGARIKDKAQAQTAFSKINALWNGVLKTALSKENADFTNKVINGAVAGTATVNGNYRQRNSSSASSTYNSKILDATIHFQDYETEGIKLNGTIRFYDSYVYQMRCSSSACASSTDTYIAYRSKDGSKQPFPPFYIEYVQDGKRVSDSLLVDAEKQYSNWAVELTTGDKTVYTFKY